MHHAMLRAACLLSMMYWASCTALDEETKTGVVESLSQSDPEDPDKRGWNNLSGVWGKRGWNNLSGSWGKRGWNNLSGVWGKREWNEPESPWNKRGWNNLSGMWGKRGWNNLSGMWGKRGWNNLSGMWGKRNREALGDKRTTQWNNLKGVWGKRSDEDWRSVPLWEGISPAEEELQRQIVAGEV